MWEVLDYGFQSGLEESCNCQLRAIDTGIHDMLSPLSIFSDCLNSNGRWLDYTLTIGRALSLLNCATLETFVSRFHNRACVAF